MRNKLPFIVALALAVGWLTVGCHAQMPPTNHTVSLTLTAPSGCSGASPACTYVFSKITVTGSSCPTPNTTTPNYTPMNSSSPTTATSYVDAGSAGTTVCYIAQTEQGSAVSQPSNTAGPYTVPANPSAPTLGTGTVAEVKQPQVKISTSSNAPELTARVR